MLSFATLCSFLVSLSFIFPLFLMGLEPRGSCPFFSLFYLLLGWHCLPVFSDFGYSFPGLAVPPVGRALPPLFIFHYLPVVFLPFLLFLVFFFSLVISPVFLLSVRVLEWRFRLPRDRKREGFTAACLSSKLLLANSLPCCCYLCYAIVRLVKLY